MSSAPTFNLQASNIGMTDAEIQAGLEKKSGNFFDTPGPMDLTITAAEWHANKITGETACRGDSTWHNVKLTLQAADGREINHWIQVPTSKIEFGEKRTLFVYGKFQEFLISFGEAVTNAKLQGLLEKYFAKLDKLVGQKVSVTLGYEGPYVQKAPDSDEFVIMVKGQPLKDEGVEVRQPDRSTAIQYAKSQGLDPSFIRILKFMPKKVAKTLKAANQEW